MRMISLRLLPLLAAAPFALCAADPAPSEAPLITLPSQVPAKPASSPAQRELQAIVIRQQRLFIDAAKENNPNFDEDNFKQHAQDILYDYEAYIKKYPDVAAGYAAYGVFLSKTGMRRESIAMFMRANKLDANIPLVKNQIGNYLAEEGKVIEAANYFGAAVSLDPQEPLYHYQMGTLLREGREVFLKSGQWTADALEREMFKAFKRAAELAPNRIEFTYRFCEAYYDLANPVWDEALAAWGELENRVTTALEKDTIRLHRANILLKQNRVGEARELLATVSNPTLSKQKEKLIAELPENRKP